MFCFAFGADLDPDVRRSRVPESRAVGLAALRDQRVSFPRYSPEWQGGVAGLHAHHGGAVWGLVYEVSEAELAALDRLEGFRAAGDPHNVADRAVVLVELTRPDDGSPPRRVQCVVYLPRPSNASPPSAEYREAMLRGARHHGLPEEYLVELAALPVRDPA